jgi:pyruvate-ferredoxin/flavodoxin oxidoreductase
VDFAITENRFRKHFRVAPVDTWSEDMVPLAEFLDLEEDDREGVFPFVWSVNEKQQLTRLLVAKPMVESCEDRRDFWIMLRALGGASKASREEIEAEVRGEIAGRIATGLMQLAGGDGAGVAALAGAMAAPASAAVAPAEGAPVADGDYLAPWIDTEQCTTCDECTKLNPQIFAYNENKKAYIANPLGGPYKDLVKAAERCTARVIHPGLPRDRSAKDIDKWIKRGEKFN